ncbi:MAG: DUF6600 domain-containing protein [Beijerinckiaceae bacterium]
MPRARTKLLCTTLLVGGLGLGMAPFAPSLFNSPAHAQQRVEVRQEFRVALEPHGRFERHARYGEVWRPARVARDWRPYTVGRWVYTDDWGWYWNADQSEADWGWVAFHYGRWIDDREMGWVWVPGNEWGPAWVNWRRGEGPAVAARNQRGPANVRYIGWAPLPPDDVVVEYRDNPDVWIFVRAGDIVAPRIHTVVIRERRPEILQRTVIVNRTVVVRDRGVIVNPGISPAYVAAFVGKPIVSYEVRPRVIAGTARINNAIELRADDLRDRRRLEKERPQIRETRTRIEPARDIPAPQALQANEQGRLGDRPPRAAQGATDLRPERTTGERGPGQLAPGERPTTTTQDRRDLTPAATGSTPGQAETSPGRAGETPGQTEAQPPGRAGAAPGRAGETPGQAGTAPGRQDRATGERSNRERTGSDTRTTTEPGRSGAAPGRTGSTPGQAETAPGRAGDTPGQSGVQPPGRAGTAPGPAGDTPGQAGTAPGRSADTPGRQQERGAQRDDRSQQNRGAQQREERAQPQQRQERASEPRGGRGETTGSTPNRGGGNEAREQRAPQKPDANERRRERESQ